MAALSGVTVQFAQSPIVAPLAKRVASRKLGLTHRLQLPAAARDALAIVLMDYTFYLWHVLTHRWDALYRLHQVHHSDLDLDVSTAVRFHAAEMLVSVPWRAAQVRLIGVSPRALEIWQLVTLCSVLFHHSNWRLPMRVERWLSRLIATPRLHGIHHSNDPDLQNSNWSSGLTIWDRLHRTYRDDVPQDAITIGMPRYRMRHQVTFGQLLRMPRITASEARSSSDL